MTSHELARKLLALPDQPVCVHDDADRWRPVEICDVNQYGGDHQYRDESDAPQRGEHVTLS